jgi:uncharacterized phage-associated protein
MFHHFELEKAIQAAGVLLRAHPGRQMSAVRLSKLLYFADRENLKAAARPIIGNHIVAHDDGPGHWELRGVLRNERNDVSWNKYFQKEEDLVELIDDPGVLDLSAQEIETLANVAESHREQGDLELIEIARQFPEWRKHASGGYTQREIPWSDILEAVGWSDEDRAAILEEFDDEERLERLLDRNPAVAKP